MTPEQATLSDIAATNARTYFDNLKLIQSPLLSGAPGSLAREAPILFTREYLDTDEELGLGTAIYISVGRWKARIYTVNEAERRAREAVAIYTGGTLR